MTAPRWLLRLLAARGLGLRTDEDRQNADLAAEVKRAWDAASERLARAHDAEIRAEQAEHKLARIADLLRGHFHALRGELDIPDFRAAATDRRVPRREPERVAA